MGSRGDRAETSDLRGLSSLGEDARRAFALDNQLQTLDARMPVDIVRERDGQIAVLGVGIETLRVCLMSSAISSAEASACRISSRRMA